MTKSRFTQTVQRFSIRKYSFGAASVLLGAFFLAGSPVAQADEVTTISNETTLVAQTAQETSLSGVDTTTSSDEQVSSEVTTTSQAESATQEQAATSQPQSAVVADDTQSAETRTEDTTVPTQAVTDMTVSDETADVTTKSEGESVSNDLNANDVAEPSKATPDITEAVADDVTEDEDFSDLDDFFNQEDSEETTSNARASRALGDNYPAYLKNAPADSLVDPWGQYSRECTSFTAFRLSTVNNFEIPRAYGWAGVWGTRAQSEGYRVDMNPAIGSVAWDSTHVAWVSDVIGNNVEIEEYNYPYNHSYNKRIVSKNSFKGFIHFKDLPNTTNIAPQVKGNIAIENNDDAAGTFDVVVRNVSSNLPISVVSLPTWTENNGQDDLVWHEASRGADGNYRLTVNINQHKNERGLYNVHLYYKLEDGRMVGVGGTQTKVNAFKDEVAGTISVQNKTTSGFDVIISGVKSSRVLETVSVPIWSAKNDQDDLKWYNAQKQADGTYKVHVNVADHKNDYGTYLIHLYYAQRGGHFRAVAGTETTLEAPKEEKLSGTISIRNKNDQAGTFDVFVSDISCPTGVQAVRLPVWATTNGQDDIIWYTAERQADGTYKTSVKASDHKNYSGEYNIHLYYARNDGQFVGVAATTTNLNYVARPTRPNIPNSGSYRFTGYASVRPEPRVSATELANYDAGMSVNYDSVLESDGHYWISYIAASGNRRYISIT